MSKWQNRIVGNDTVNPEELCANPRNWRIHPQHQQDALHGLLGDVGWVQNILVNRRTGYVVDGHARVALALRHGQAAVPVTYVDLADDEEALVLASLDPIGSLAVADTEHLEALLREVTTGDAAVQELLAGLAERSGIVPPEFDDPAEHWVGMPEFGQDDLMPAKQVIVNFASEADVLAFGRLVEQNVTMTTKSVWWPAVEKRRLRDFAYVGSDDAA